MTDIYIFLFQFLQHLFLIFVFFVYLKPLDFWNNMKIVGMTLPQENIGV